MGKRDEMRCLYDLNMCDGLVGYCKVLLRLLIGDAMNVNERDEHIENQSRSSKIS